MKVSYDKASLQLTKTLIATYYNKKHLIIDEKVKGDNIEDWLRRNFLHTMEVLYFNSYNKKKKDFTVA